MFASFSSPEAVHLESCLKRKIESGSEKKNGERCCPHEDKLLFFKQEAQEPLCHVSDFKNTETARSVQRRRLFWK
uniref:Uncharacterized protein n=1 Tax=Anguilla anguilla TaxID=7936 RepID=A0A0E9S8D3_ANGAN